MVSEDFDDDGNVLSVGNFKFVEGILGKGSYGTVRLAKRIGDSTPASTPLNLSQHSHGKRPVNVSKSLNSPPTPRRLHHQKSEDAMVTPPPISLAERKRGFKRRMSTEYTDEEMKVLQRTSSAPYGKDPFATPVDKVPRVVNQLGLMVRQGLQKASSQIGSFLADDDDGDDDTPADNLYAVKIYHKSLLKKMRTMERDKQTRKVKVRTALEQVDREIALMKKMHHPNLVSLFEVIDSPESDLLYMVIEYMPLGEILTYQNDGTFRRSDEKALVGYNDKKGHFDEATAALFFVDILHGLAYLHQHRVCHRDLKPENILLDSRGIVKIGDFGVAHFFDGESNTSSNIPSSTTFDDDDHNHSKHDSKILSRQDTERALAMQKLSNAGMLHKTEGTWCFYSPEMAAGETEFSGFAADMWAAGICLYIFASGKLPFYSENPPELFESIVEDDVPYADMSFSNTLLDLLKATLHKDAKERAGVGDCLKHPFLTVAREKRVHQLSIAFDKSRKRTLIVSEEDVRKAFRVVTALLPVEIFRTTTVAIRDGFQAAREKLSLSRTSSWQSNEEIDDDDEDEDDIEENDNEDDEDDIEDDDESVDKIGGYMRPIQLVETSDRVPTRGAAKKLPSTLSQGTSNISDVSSDDGRKKLRFGRFRSKKEGRKSTRKRNDDKVNERKEDLCVNTADGKKVRIRKGSRLRVRNACVIS